MLSITATVLYGSSLSLEIVPLFGHGQTDKGAETKSDRQCVKANCGLVTKKVTHQDVCQDNYRQFMSGRQQETDSHVHLSIVYILMLSPQNQT